MYRADRPDPGAIARAKRAAATAATAASALALALPADAGLVLPAGHELPKAWAARVSGDWTSSADPRTSFYPRTLWWDPAVPLRLELVPVGFNFLHHWHVAAPLYDYNTLAFQHGTIEERLATTAAIGDLRVPLYETRALFLRRCDETNALLAAWALEREGGGDERLAFQRALWTVKPLILPLPITWIEGKHA